MLCVKLWKYNPGVSRLCYNLRGLLHDVDAHVEEPEAALWCRRSGRMTAGLGTDGRGGAREGGGEGREGRGEESWLWKERAEGESAGRERERGGGAEPSGPPWWWMEGRQQKMSPDTTKWHFLVLTLFLPGKVKIDLANFDVKFRTKFLSIGFDKNLPIIAETCSKSFWTSELTSKNDVFTSILTFFHQKSGRCATLWTPLLLTGFTTITDHPRMGEIPPGRGPQCDVAPSNIPISFWSQAECEGMQVLSQACSLALSKCSIYVAAPFWADFQNRSALLHICWIPGEVSSHLLKVRSKQNGPQ